MTIKDIARLSGYGVGTVSRVLNNHPDVSESTRQKILAVIAEHNFEPNSNAKHLKMRANSSLEIIVKGTQNFLFADILEKMQSLFLKSGENVSINYIDEDENEVAQAVLLCRERTPKGIVFLGGNLDYFQSDFKGIDVPCILVTNNAEGLQIDNLSSLTTPDEEASKEVIEYLISKGHKNIGVLGGTLCGTQISQRRIAGARRGMEASGLSFDPQLQFQPCRFSMEEGYRATKLLLEKYPSATAIFALGDSIAIGVLRALFDLEKRVPEDFSVVGFDGVNLSNYCIPRLTTIIQDTDALARKGVDMMLQRINYPAKGEHISVPYKLVERESVSIR